MPAAGTSTFFAYPKTGFSGTPTVVTGCGIHSLPAVVNSYSWVAHGQSGQMYNCLDAACGVNFTLSSNQDASQSTHVGWKSILIVC